MEMPSAVCISDLENSAPVISQTGARCSGGNTDEKKAERLARFYSGTRGSFRSLAAARGHHCLKADRRDSFLHIIYAGGAFPLIASLGGKRRSAVLRYAIGCA